MEYETKQKQLHKFKQIIKFSNYNKERARQLMQEQSEISNWQIHLFFDDPVTVLSLAWL